MSTNAIRTTLRPAAERTDYRRRSRYREAGVVIALIGMMLAAVALIGNIVVADDGPAGADTLAWTFGLSTAAFAAVMLGIATVLVGIR